jgi:hypothetical protein
MIYIIASFKKTLKDATVNEFLKTQIVKPTLQADTNKEFVSTYYLLCSMAIAGTGTFTTVCFLFLGILKE